jgi:hypothetical protein
LEIPVSLRSEIFEQPEQLEQLLSRQRSTVEKSLRRSKNKISAMFFWQRGELLIMQAGMRIISGAHKTISL